MLMVPVVALAAFPFASYKNVGYVDTNLYMGYGFMHSWLNQVSSTEYHSTRILFILVIKFSLLFGSSAGIIFRLILNFLLVLSAWMFSNFEKDLDKKTLLIFYFGLLTSPIWISATSWSLAQGFSIALGLLALAVLTRAHKNVSYILFGFLLLNTIISNAFIGFQTLLMASYLIVRGIKNEQKIRSFHLTIIIISMLISQALNEIYYRVFAHGSKSVTELQLDAIFNINRWQTEYWLSPARLIHEKSALIYLGFFLITGFILPITIRLKARRSRYVDLYFGLSIISSTYVLTTYLNKSFPGWTDIWYFYCVFYAVFFGSLYFLFSGLSSPIIISIFVVNLLIVLKNLSTSENSQYPLQTLILLLTTLWIAFILASNLLSNRIFRQKFTITVLIISIICYPISQLPALKSAYNPSVEDQRLIEDQRFLAKYVSSITPIKHNLASWAAPDVTNFTGYIESTLGFHMIRLNGMDFADSQPNFESWVARFNCKPRYLLSIEDRKFIPESSMAIIIDNGFKKIDQIRFPDGKIWIEEFELQGAKSCEK